MSRSVGGSAGVGCSDDEDGERGGKTEPLQKGKRSTSSEGRRREGKIPHILMSANVGKRRSGRLRRFHP